MKAHVEFSHQQLELVADTCEDRFAYFAPYGGPLDGGPYGGRVTLSSGIVVSVSYHPDRSWGELAIWREDEPDMRGSKTHVIGDVYETGDVSAFVDAIIAGDADLSFLRG